MMMATSIYALAFLAAALEPFLSVCVATHLAAKSFNIINVPASILLISISISFSSSYWIDKRHE
jgi:hypothetical protein